MDHGLSPQHKRISRKTMINAEAETIATSSVADKKRKNDYNPKTFSSNGSYNPEYWHPTGLAKSEWYPCRTTPNLRPAGGQPFPLRKGKQYRMEGFRKGDNPNDTTPAPECPPVLKKRKTHRSIARNLNVETHSSSTSSTATSTAASMLKSAPHNSDTSKDSPSVSTSRRGNSTTTSTLSVPHRSDESCRNTSPDGTTRASIEYPSKEPTQSPATHSELRKYGGPSQKLLLLSKASAGAHIGSESTDDSEEGT